MKLWTNKVSQISFLFFTFYSNVFIPECFCDDSLTLPEVKLDRMCFNSRPVKCLNKTELEKTSSLLDFFSNNSIFMTEDELLVSFECKAPYPVEWVHSQEQWLTLVTPLWFPLLRTRITTFTRISVNMHDPSTFQYSTVFTVTYISGEFKYGVGQYKCRSVAEPTSETTTNAISVFSEGNVYEKAFALSEKNVTIWIGEAADNPVIFPCHVVHPSAAENAKIFKKALFRAVRLPPRKLNFTRIAPGTTSIIPARAIPFQMKEKWVEIRQNHNFHFLAELGWVYNKTIDHFTKFQNSFKLSPGSYKCAMDGDDEDFVGIQLKTGKPPHELPIDEPITSNATVKYVLNKNQKTINVKCCSSSANPPKLFIIVCFNHFTCQQQKTHFASLDSQGPNHAEIGIIRATGSCMHSSSLSYGFLYPYNVRCIGDGINYSKSLYFPLVGHNITDPYINWEAVDPYSMLAIFPSDWDWKTKDIPYTRPFTYYDGETVRIQCVTVSSYFSIGSKVEVGLENGSAIIAKEGADHHEKIKNLFGAYTLLVSVKLQKLFKSFTCYAPILHSDRWIKKTVKLNVIDSHSPTILGSTVRKDVFWTLNDTMQTLSCEFSGLPMPTSVEWEKDDVVIKISTSSNDRYNYSMLHGNTSVLLVNVATYETHGIYTCTVKNVIGTATKTFKVFVRASETSWIIFSMSLGILSLVMIVGLLIFKTWKQRQLLDRSKGTFEGGGFAR